MPDVVAITSSVTFLVVSMVAAGFITTVSQEWAAHGNATGVGPRPKHHTFDHRFFMQCCMFGGQFACLGIWWLMKGRYLPQDNPEQDNGARIAEIRARQQRATAAENVNVIGAPTGRDDHHRPGRQRAEGQDGEDELPVQANPKLKKVNELEEINDADVNPFANGAAGGEGLQNENGAAGGARPKTGTGILPETDGVRARNRAKIEENAADEIKPDATRPARANAARAQGGRQNLRIARRIQQNKKKYRKFIFLPCALCDLAKTGLLFIGLRQTYPTSFIMFQGQGLLATCMLTVAFVGKEKTVHKIQWVGITVIIIGFAVTGLIDYLPQRDPTYDPYGIAAGDLLIVMAQLMTAIQVILEQRFVKKHDIDPLKAVGLEGMYGFCLTAMLMIPFYFVNVGAFNTLPKHRLENVADAVLQMVHEPSIFAWFLGAVIFLPIYYVIGITIMKRFDAVTRMGVDILVNVTTWVVFLGQGWEVSGGSPTIPALAKGLPVLGYFLVIVGMFVFFFFPLKTLCQEWRARRRGYEHVEGGGDAGNVQGGYGAGDDAPQQNRPM